jgi:GNAT superfamily N-acetyltransferase
VRRLGPGDWGLLRDLRLQARADTPGAFLVHPEQERPDVPADWRAFLASGTWLVASVAGADAGVACVVIDPGTARRYLQSMWVDPLARRRGVASALLAAAAALARADGCAGLYLWVLEGNPGARACYERRGFRPTGDRQRIGPGPGIEEVEFRAPTAPWVT